MVIVYLTKPKNVLLLLQNLIKNMICLKTILRIHRVAGITGLVLDNGLPSGRDRLFSLCALRRRDSELETRWTGKWRPLPSNSLPKAGAGNAVLDRYP